MAQMDSYIMEEVLLVLAVLFILYGACWLLGGFILMIRDRNDI